VPPPGGPNVKPFHLASQFSQRTEPHATHGLCGIAGYLRQQQHASGWAVLPRQTGQLGGELLKIESETEGIGILAKQLVNLLHLGGATRLDDPDLTAAP